MTTLMPARLHGELLSAAESDPTKRRTSTRRGQARLRCARHCSAHMPPIALVEHADSPRKRARMRTAKCSITQHLVHKCVSRGGKVTGSEVHGTFRPLVDDCARYPRNALFSVEVR